MPYNYPTFNFAILFILYFTVHFYCATHTHSAVYTMAR